MNNKVTKLAAAAVILIAIGLSFIAIDKSATPVWAELVQRVERSYDEYMQELLLAIETKNTQKVASYADALSEFWQGLNMLAEAKLDPTIQFQSENSAEIIRGKTFYDSFEQSEQQVFMIYAEQFIGWLNKIEDAAWIYEIVHVCKQMEEYAEEIRDVGHHPEMEFSYAEHCLPSFLTYCKWFERLPWDNPEQVMKPATLLIAIQRDLEIARREIEAREIIGVIRFVERCVQQAHKNALDLIKKTRPGMTKKQRNISKHLTRRIEELSALITYAKTTRQDFMEQETKLYGFEDGTRYDQVLIEEFDNKGTFTDYYIERIDQSLDLCRQLSDEFGSTPLL